MAWLFLSLCSLTWFPAIVISRLCQDREPLSPFTPEFDALVMENLNHWHVPGLSVAVVDDDETFSKGYGIAAFPTQNVTPSTLFYTGSTTKAFTAAAYALLIDDSANTSSPLSWQTPVSSLIRDDFVVPDDYATLHVTVEDALSHRTGMPRHDFSYGGVNYTLRDVVRGMRNLPLTAEIRTKFQYCNMMYMTMSHVIETLTSSWLGDFFWERIWKPLDMSRTYFSIQQAQAAVDHGFAELATPYMWNNVTKEFMSLPYIDLITVSGAGAIISNVLDYAKWLRFLIDDAPPLSKAGHEALRTSRTYADLGENPSFTGTQNYGLGWILSNFHGEPLIAHNGGLPGFGAFIGYLPRKRWGVASMGNSDVTSSLVENILCFRMLADRLNVPSEERFSWANAMEENLHRLNDTVQHAREKLYPTAPNKTGSIPLSRPLEAYAGLYSSPGYHNVTISVATRSVGSSLSNAAQSPLGHSSESKIKYLHSSITRTWPASLEFEHVSGDFFIVWLRIELGQAHGNVKDPLQVEPFKAEFRIGEDGKVSKMGALLEPLMGEKKIWFHKLE